MPDHLEERQAASHHPNETKTVLVDEDYLAFLEDELSENQVRLREILGENQARAVFSWSADRLVSTVGTGRHALNPIEGLVQKLEGWGMTVLLKEKEKITELEVKCPYAERMHPQLSSREPRCPLGEYVLGAVRLENSKSQLIHNSLTKQGIRFTIEKREG